MDRAKDSKEQLAKKKKKKKIENLTVTQDQEILK